MIVLKTVAYSESSLIVQAYTEKFGAQSYLIKSARKPTKTSNSKAIYFQPTALLKVSVTHTEHKNLQFIKEVEWSVVYTNIFSQVHKNMVAIYVAELIQHSIKQPESNAELFYFIEQALAFLDSCNAIQTANFPIIFTIQFAKVLGFGIEGTYSTATPLFSLTEGRFVADTYIDGKTVEEQFSKLISEFAATSFENTIQLNKSIRNKLLLIIMEFYQIHVSEFGKLKCLDILFQLFE